MSWGYTIIRTDGMALARAAGTWRGEEMNLQLNGKMAVVTDSTAGLGFAIAATLAEGNRAGKPGHPITT